MSELQRQLDSLTERVVGLETVHAEDLAKVLEQLANMEQSSCNCSDVITFMDDPTDLAIYEKAATMGNYGLLVVSRPDD